MLLEDMKDVTHPCSLSRNHICVTACHYKILPVTRLLKRHQKPYL